MIKKSLKKKNGDKDTVKYRRVYTTGPISRPLPGPVWVMDVAGEAVRNRYAVLIVIVPSGHSKVCRWEGIFRGRDFYMNVSFV